MSPESRFGEALKYAAELHAAQRRKISGEPYVAHLLAVAALVLEHGGDEDEAIAALLHDAIEDQGGAATRGEILRRFGPRVTEIVEGCTDADVQPKPPWLARKEAHIARMGEASDSVRLIAVADKVHNADSILRAYRLKGDALWEHFNGGKDGTLWYYRAMLTALESRGRTTLTARLADVVEALEAEAGGPG
jgi:GTP pyrophosphokinase